MNLPPPQREEAAQHLIAIIKKLFPKANFEADEPGAKDKVVPRRNISKVRQHILEFSKNRYSTKVPEEKAEEGRPVWSHRSSVANANRAEEPDSKAVEIWKDIMDSKKQLFKAHTFSKNLMRSQKNVQDVASTQAGPSTKPSTSTRANLTVSSGNLQAPHERKEE